MDQFPSNARTPPQRSEPTKDAPKDKHITPVVTGDVVRRKKPRSSVVLDVMRNAWGSVFLDVLVPAAKDMLVDGAIQGMERTIYGESRPTGRRAASGYGRGYPPSHTPYNRMAGYNNGSARVEPGRREISDRGRQRHELYEIVLATRVEAEEVLTNMIDLIERYGQVSVGEFYELVGTSATWVDNKWGWKNLGDAYPSHVKNGYLINLPRPIELD